MVRQEKRLRITVGGLSADVEACALLKSAGEKYVLHYLSMVGHRDAVRAVWAGLVNVPPIRVFMQDQDTQKEIEVILSPERWHFKNTNLKKVRAFVGIMFPQSALLTFTGAEFILVIPTSAQISAQELYYERLNKITTLPLAPEWTSWLWEKGRKTGQVKFLITYGPVEVYLCKPDEEAMRVSIKEALTAERALSSGTIEMKREVA